MSIGACSPYDTPETRGTYSIPTIPHADPKTTLDHRSEPTTHSDDIGLFHNENKTPVTPPINILPTEILIRIFELAHYLWWKTFFKKERADWPTVWDRSIRKQMDLAYPEVLTHVCSLWRHIVLPLSSLWPHIDIFTLGHPPQLSLTRSSILVARAQNHPLTLRVRLRHGVYEPVSECIAINDFCSSIGPRLSTLHIDNNAPGESTTILSSIIQASLPRTTPGILTILDIKDHSVRSVSNYGNNIDGLTGWALPSAENLGISQHRLDDIVRPIRSLRLSGEFFPWTSPAYRGLVDLHLLCTRPQYGHRPSIQVAQLREILLACPELRIFHINININERVTQPPPSPVPLNELEELNLRGLKRCLYDILLPLIIPGQKPLQLSFQTPRDAPTILYCPALLDFFQRTNVASLYIVNRHTIYQQLPLDILLIQSPPNLYTLGLERFQIIDTETFSRHLAALPPMQLSYLCLRKCIIGTSALENMDKIFRAQVLKIHESEFEDVYDGAEAWTREEMNLVFPIVKWVRSTRGMELWGAWEVEYFD